MVLDTFNRFEENRINPTEPIRRFYHYLSPITNDQTEEICLVLNCVPSVQHYPLIYNRYEILQWYIVCNFIELVNLLLYFKISISMQEQNTYDYVGNTISVAINLHELLQIISSKELYPYGFSITFSIPFILSESELMYM